LIPLRRLPLDDELLSALAVRTAGLVRINADSGRARRAWSSARQEKRRLRAKLLQMAPGIYRCMYCGDNLGTDIDHFEPINRAPLRTFDWDNHLLACSYCNSNSKRAEYPVDAAGQALLIDPVREDPARHLTLILSTGRYEHLTEKGRATIDVFGLNRVDLVRGRASAFHIRRAVLTQARAYISEQRLDEASTCLLALTEQPHASVLIAMLSVLHLPGADVVLGRDVVEALSDRKIRSLLGQWPLPAPRSG
jgi:uncharacterized protein (TIGR02646 family)